MNYIKSFFCEYWYYFVIGVLTLILCLTTFLLFNESQEISPVKDNNSLVVNNEYESNEICKVDLKGAVKKPGVYDLDCDKSINDLIQKAGGLTKVAYTNNINLSKRIENEMVVYVYTKKEIEKKSTITEENKIITLTEPCICNDLYIDACTEKSSSTIIKSNEVEVTQSKENEKLEVQNEEQIPESSPLISINTASMEQLTSINGIGQSKAESIISYRNSNGLFKTIEDIKNVSGIGDALFEKIKPFITI